MISIPNPQLITPPNGVIHNFSFNISIKENTPANKKLVFTITFTTRDDFSSYPKIQRKLLEFIYPGDTFTDDIWVKT